MNIRGRARLDKIIKRGSAAIGNKQDEVASAKKFSLDDVREALTDKTRVNFELGSRHTRSSRYWVVTFKTWRHTN